MPPWDTRAPTSVPNPPGADSLAAGEMAAEPRGEPAPSATHRTSASSPHSMPVETSPLALPGPTATPPTVVHEVWGSPSAATLRAVEQSRLGQHGPSSVTLRANPTDDAPMTAPLQASWDNWVDGHAPPGLPTHIQLRKWMREGLASSADPATASLAEEALKARPLAYDPEGMIEAAHKAGWAAAAPATYVAGARKRPHSGSFPPANVDALFALHKARCENCSGNVPCYGATGHNLIRNFEWPFLSEPPPHTGPPPAPPPYSKDLADLYREGLGLGVLVRGDAARAKGFAHAFNAPRRKPILPEGSEAALTADPSGRTVMAVASTWAKAFVPVYQGGLASGLTAAAAWEKALDACGTANKNRLVVDLSHIGQYTRDLPMRYATVEPLITGCTEGDVFGKTDLSKGFWQLMNADNFMPYSAIMAVLEPDGPPTCLYHDRACMGGKPIPWIFSVYTGFIREAILAALPHHLRVVLIVYLDDLAYRCSSREDWWTLTRTINQILEAVGAQRNPDKCTKEPSTREEVLGLELASTPPSIGLPRAAEIKTACLLQALLECAGSNTPVPVRALASLAGRSGWRGMVDPHIPSHTRTIAGLATPEPQWWRRATAAFNWESSHAAPQLTGELRWLAGRIAATSSRTQRLLGPGPKARVYASSDASGPHNTVSVTLPTIAFRFRLPNCGGVVIPVMESLATPLLLAHLKGALDNTSIVWGLDCIGAAYWMANAKARRSEANDIQRLLVHYQERSASRLTAKWLSRAFNHLSDRACTAPWDRLLQGDLKGAPLPTHLVEITVEGLPPQFLAAWAASIHPQGFTFSESAWLQVNEREG